MIKWIIKIFKNLFRKKKISFYTTVLKAGVKNKNNRIYPKEILHKIVDDCQNRIDEGIFYGEIGHSDHNGISLNNISHKVDELKVEEDSLIAHIETVETSSGKTLRDLEEQIKSGAIVFRPKGFGTLDENGCVNEDYQILSFDAIPSSEDSFNFDNDNMKKG